MQTPTPPNLNKPSPPLPTNVDGSESALALSTAETPPHLTPDTTSPLVSLNEFKQANMTNSSNSRDRFATLSSAKKAYPEASSTLAVLEAVGILLWLSALFTAVGAIGACGDARGGSPYLSLLLGSCAGGQFVAGLLLRAVGQMMQSVLDGSVAVQRVDLHLRRVWPE